MYFFALPLLETHPFPCVSPSASLFFSIHSTPLYYHFLYDLLMDPSKCKSDLVELFFSVIHSDISSLEWKKNVEDINVGLLIKLPKKNYSFSELGRMHTPTLSHRKSYNIRSILLASHRFSAQLCDSFFGIILSIRFVLKRMSVFPFLLFLFSTVFLRFFYHFETNVYLSVCVLLICRWFDYWRETGTQTIHKITRTHIVCVNVAKWKKVPFFAHTIFLLSQSCFSTQKFRYFFLFL